MARKSRYLNYMDHMETVRRKLPGGRKSKPESLLRKLKSLKGQEFHMMVPIGGDDGE